MNIQDHLSHDAFYLPVGVYLVSPEGTLIKYNTRLAEILGIPESGCTKRLTDFYYTPEERPEILKKVEAAEGQGRFLEGQVIKLRVRRRTAFVQISCRSVKDDSGRIIGYLGCMVDVTKEQHYRSLIDTLPVGTYTLDTSGTMIEANVTTARLFGADSPEAIIGRKARDFYASDVEFFAVQNELETNGFIAHRLIELKTLSDTRILVAASAFNLVGDEGIPLGRHGTLVDATAQEYLQILTESPVGLYVTRLVPGGEVVRHCNETYAKLFGFSAASAAVGFDVRELYENPGDYTALRNQLNRDNGILGQKVRARKRTGECFDVEVSTTYLHDQASNLVVGRVGVVRDITKESELRDRIDELTFDIGRVFHAYSAMLVMVKLCLDSVRRFVESEHGPVPSPGGLTTAIEEDSRLLLSALDRLFAFREDAYRRLVISDKHWETLENQKEVIRDYKTLVPLPETQPAALRDSATRIAEIITKAHRGHIAREILREIQKSAQRLQRDTILSELEIVTPAVLDIDYTVRALREFVSMDARPPVSRASVLVSNLLTPAIKNLAAFAFATGVQLRRSEVRGDMRVNVSEKDMIRVISNVLHNAFKYSWARDDAKPPWVDLRTRRIERNAVIEIENWGVPIPQDEIDNESIFQLGVRGRLANDRGRIGTGIGLADARRTARQNGGDVVISSRPAHPPPPSDPYSVPYLTTVTLTIPLEQDD